MGRWQRPGLTWLVLAVYLLPAPALAQSTKAGVVTALEGNVTAVRSVAPQPVVLKFKDDVYLQDRVVTGDQSFARLLLGGKAVIGIRERSAVTITEIPGRSTIDVESGKIALSVARDRMQPGEVIHIKTPNAVAGVRGTVVVAQVTYGLGPSGAREPTSNLWVIRGLVEAVHTNLHGAPQGAPFNLSPNESLNATSTTATTGTFTADQIGTIVQGLRPTRTQDGGSASQDPARLEAVNTATALLNTLVGMTEGEKQIALLTGPPPQIASADTLPPQRVTSAADVALSPLTLGESTVQQEALPPNTFTLPHVFSGPTPLNPPGTGPMGSFTDLMLTQPPGDDLIRVAADANVTLLGPLVALTNSSVAAGDSFLSVAGQLTSSSPAPLISLEPTTVTASANIVEVVGPSGVLKLAGSLLKDVGGAIAAGASILAVSGGGRLTGTASDGAAPEALVQLSGTTASARTVLSVVGHGSSAALTGSLLSTQGGSLVLSGLALADVSQGGRVSSTSPLPFVTMVGTALALPETTFVVSGGQLAVGGSLLRAENITSAAAFSLFVDQGGSVSAGGPLFDLINTNGGVRILAGRTSTFTSSGPKVRGAGGMRATDTPVTADNSGNVLTRRGSMLTGGASGFQFGRQRPLQHSGGDALLEASNGALVSVWGANGAVLRLDTALLDATAPLIALTGAGTRLQTSGHAIELVNNAHLQSTKAPEGFIRLEKQAQMDVLNGHLVSVSASRLKVEGDLVRMGSNTLLNVNGVLLNVLGGGSVNINGALVAFTGVNGTINITNNLVPTSFIAGIPVSVARGGNVTIGAGALAGLNTNGNIIRINGTPLQPGAVITGSLISVGANGTVKIVGAPD